VIITNQLEHVSHRKIESTGDILVDPEIGDKVDGKHLSEASVVCPDSQARQGEEDTSIRADDLPEMGRLEDNGARGEVVGVGRVVSLTRGVSDQVCGPSEQLLHEHILYDNNGGFLNSFTELSLSESGDADTVSLE